ncbi:MAG: DUF4389 domain-containing protein [Flavobacteriales bacterium]|nr:DUF4389 domain-containing protein [Flavobacteriales bacterium]
MMTLEIKYQEQYSRGELLLRSFFGFFYIILPHAFLLLFLAIAAQVLSFLAFWVILFTGKYPQSWFEFQVKNMRWNLRLNARIYNLADGYPAFGLNAHDDHVTFDVAYPEQTSRSLTLIRALFGLFYVLIPHGFILWFLSIGVMFIQFIAWWAVLFTGRYPSSMFDFILEYLRWSQRVSLYLSYMTDTYPPFSGKRDVAPEVPTGPEVGGSTAPEDTKA